MAITVKIDEALKGRIQELAQTKQRSAHWVMREALAQYVEREERRESFKAEALASWAEFKETGLHLEWSEARAALETWGTDNEIELPPCHD